MPAGAKKRKAAKKNTKKGEAHDSDNHHHRHHDHHDDHHHHHSNRSSTYSHGSDNPKSFDERESDSDEFEGEEEDEKGKEDPVVVLTNEDSLPRNDAVGDKDVAAVEEEKSVIAECGKLKSQDASSALCVPGDEMPKVVDHVSEEAVGIVGASVEEFHKPVQGQIPDVESMKEAVSFSQEVNAGAGNLVISDVVNSGLIENMDSISQISDDKKKFSAAIEDQQSEKIETKVASIDEDKSLVAPVANSSSGVDSVKTLGAGMELEQQIVVPATTTTQVVDSVKNGETHLQSHDHLGATDANTSRSMDNGKKLESQKQLEEQAVLGSNPLSVRRTSWTGCCGLFEVFSGANK